MNKKTWTRVFPLFAIFAGAAQAGIIFDNGGTLLQGGLLSTVDTHYISADNFALESDANVVTDIHWWGYYADDSMPIPATDSFTAYIYSDAGGAPGTLLQTLTAPVTRTDTGDLTFGTYDEFSYEMDIDPLELTAGTTYWLAIQNDVDCNWFWSISDFTAGGDAHQKLQNWTVQNVEEAYYLTGPGEVMPEPSSVLLMGGGLVMVALRRKSLLLRVK